MRIEFIGDFQEFKTGQFADVPPEMRAYLLNRGKAKDAAVVVKKTAIEKPVPEKKAKK